MYEYASALGRLFVGNRNIDFTLNSFVWSIVQSLRNVLSVNTQNTTGNVTKYRCLCICKQRGD